MGVLSTMGVFSTMGDIMSTMGDILSTVGVFSIMGGYHDKCGLRKDKNDWIKLIMK